MPLEIGVLTFDKKGLAECKPSSLCPCLMTWSFSNAQAMLQELVGLAGGWKGTWLEGVSCLGKWKGLGAASLSAETP